MRLRCVDLCMVILAACRQCLASMDMTAGARSAFLAVSAIVTSAAETTCRVERGMDGRGGVPEWSFISSL